MFDRTIQSDDIDLVVSRGKLLWDDIYRPFAEKLHDKLASYHPDFIGKCSITTLHIDRHRFAATCTNLIFAHEISVTQLLGTDGF